MGELEDIDFEIGVMEERINKARLDSAIAEGAVKAYMEQLGDMGLVTVEEAVDFIDEGNDQVATETKYIIENFDALKKKYDERI